MNTPIDPREGNRRQKALLARLQALASQRSKAVVGKSGQARGRVRSVGAVGGARGARIAANGAARPGALNFLQGPGFGLRAPGLDKQGPEMHPVLAGGPPRHVRGPLPSKPLEYTVAPGQDPNFPLGAVADPTPGYGFPDGNVPVHDPNPPEGMSIWGVPLSPAPSAPAPLAGVGSSGRNAGLIPLGGGQYLDPSTGRIVGTGARPSGGGGGGGPMQVM